MNNNIAKRKLEVVHAETIIGQEIHLLEIKNKMHHVAPIIKAMKDEGLTIADNEAKKTIASLTASLSAKDQEKIQLLARSVVNKALHQPIVEIKKNASQK